ncbi:Cytoplasmic dynein 1 intermediate chain 2 (Cytoplasmic dynein intermediate chain 2) (Dynein intermediate chain 2 [Durusdinium trenchii]|uniref:Cytosolic (DH IC-2 n=1 Tax=Durusdinium trenchii TaxID=1381693 RepID=A0ABP0JP97_9DINO
MEAEIEALRREREDKIRQIAEKRKQVEELRKKRSERASLKTSQGALTSNVDGLVAEILGGAGGATSSRASPEAPLKELSEKSRASPLGAERSLHFQQEVSVAAVDIEPDGHVSYERSCQTDMKGSDVGSGGEKSAAAAGSVSKSSANVLLRVADRAKNRVLTGTTASEERRLKRAAGQEAKADAERPEIKELSEEERKKLEGHPDYKAFFERATLLVERTLGQEAWDVALDFKNTSADAQTEGGGADALKHVDDYVEEKWAKGRCVTDLRFSPHRQEIFMAAYHQKANPELSDPDGCMLVWCATEFADEQQAVLTAFSSAFSDGAMWQVNLRGSKPGIAELYEGHDGPVTGVHMHPHQGSDSGISSDTTTDLCLTSSFDWSIKLWRVKQFQSPVLTLDTFEDYVYDARWHPTHPAVFASTDGEGRDAQAAKKFGHQSYDVKIPTTEGRAAEAAVLANTDGRRPVACRLALNKCYWSMDGRKLATGDSEAFQLVF